MFGNKVGHLGCVGSLTLAQRVSAMFSRGEPGAWYDPSDLSTLFQDSAGTVPVTAVEQPVGRILDKSGRGNHAIQATTTKRPVYSRRVNAQIYSEDFTNAAFRKVSVTVTANQAVAPDGTLTADLVEGLNSGESNINSYPTYYGSGLNEQRTISVYVKKGTASTVSLNLVGFSYATLNLDTGVVSGVFDATASAEALSDGWFRFSLSFTKTNEYHWAKLIIDGGVATAGSIYVWGWQEEHGLVATRYQRVNTPTDYDADPAKFPAYRSLDGVDDSHASATGGGGTAGLFFSAAVTPQGGAGTARTLFSDAGTNTGYIVRLNTSNQLELSAGNGTTYTTIATAGTLAVGSTDIVQAWDDGTNLNVKIGNGATASIARPTVSAGTAGYTLYQDNAVATGYFNGSSYGEIYRKDSGLTQSQREAVAVYQRQKARIA